MSYAAQSWAHEQLAGTGESGAKFVLSIIGYRANKADVCWPSQQQLAEDTEQSVSTIARRLQDLEERGLIARIQRMRADGSKTSSLIVVLRSDRARALAARIRADAPKIDGVPSIAAGSEFEEDDFDVAAFLVTPTRQSDGTPSLQPDGTPSLQTAGGHPSQPEGRAPVTGEGSIESPVEPSDENPPKAPRGAARDSDSGEGRPIAARVPGFAEFWEKWQPSPTASRKNAERQWKRLTPELQIRNFATVEPYRRACEAEGRRRVDPSKFLARGLAVQFDPEPIGPKLEDTPFRREIFAIRRLMISPGAADKRAWHFADAGSPAWNEWQKAFRLAGLPPLSPKFFPARPLAGADHARERHGDYFPSALPPTASEADLLAGVAVPKAERNAA